MGDEEQARPERHRAALAPVVERGQQRLAGAGGGDHEVAPAPVKLSFGCEVIQDRLLERVGLQRDEEQRLRLQGPSTPSMGFVVEGPPQARAAVLRGGIERLELAALPQGLEGAGELLQHVQHVHLADLHGPLEAAAERGTGQVGGAHVGGAEPGVAMEQPGLGVKPRTSPVVRDTHLGAGELGHGLDGLGLRGAGVGRRQARGARDLRRHREAQGPLIRP